jgi:hypothetical protein
MENTFEWVIVEGIRFVPILAWTFGENWGDSMDIRGVKVGLGLLLWVRLVRRLALARLRCLWVVILLM